MTSCGSRRPSYTHRVPSTEWSISAISAASPPSSGSSRYVSGTWNTAPSAATRCTSMPTRPLGSSNRYEPISSTAPAADGPHGCVGAHSAMRSDLVGVIVARWKRATPVHRTTRGAAATYGFAMALTTPHGPLGSDPAGWFSEPLPPDVAYIEPHPRRIEAVLDGRVVIDTERALLVHRPNRFLQYAFPEGDVGDLASKPEPDAPGYVRVRWDAVDEWYEEGRRLVNYPPNPYHRVDLHPTMRRLRVDVAGATLVDTDDTLILFETSLAPRLYVDPKHVRTDLLRRTETTTWCNYKGVATYWAAVIGDATVEDVAWTYEDPLPESTLIKGWLSF